ncbi:MAG: hypothetical protein ACLQSR_00965 [Limisphaerales bacterium]
MSSLSNLSAKQLRQAAELKDQIVSLQSELNRILGGSSAMPVEAAEVAEAAPRRRKRKPMSAAAKAKIAAAARLRWKKAKAAGKNRL